MKDKDKNEVKSFRPKIFFSPRERHPLLEPNKLSSKKCNSIKQENKKRCATSYNISNSKNNLSKFNNSSKSNINKINPIITNILDDNYKLKDDLKFRFNIIYNIINNFKKKKKIKFKKNDLDIGKIRKNLKLNNVPSIVDEVDVVMNNVKKLENILKKNDIYLLRKVAKTVIREDKLANRIFVYENNPLHIKFEKMQERRNAIKNENQEMDIEENMAEEERNEMVNLFKDDKPDFFKEEYLSTLIKRYRSLNVK